MSFSSILKPFRFLQRKLK